MVTAAALSFVESIVKFFTTIYDVISGLFNDVVFVVENVGNAINRLPSYLGFLPSSVVTLFMSGVTIIVVYKILGRD